MGFALAVVIEANHSRSAHGERRRQGIHWLRFDNPWISSELRLISRDGRIYVTAVTMNGQTASLPPDTLYWDTTAPEKQTWSSAIGQYQVVSRHKKVRAMGRDFENCIEIKETNRQGQPALLDFRARYRFCPIWRGKRCVRLGQTRTYPGQRASIRVGLDANPFANEGYSSRSVEARFRQARDAGVNFIYISPKWNEIETGREKYKLNDVGYRIGEAVQENLPAILHIRVIDTNQRAMPADLMDKPFDARKPAHGWTGCWTPFSRGWKGE